MITHKIHLTRTNIAGKCAMTHNGQSLGVSRTPLFSAARKLLQLDLAKPEDRIETYRDNIMSMAGPVWAAAKLTVDEERSSGAPTFRLWKPFDAGTFHRWCVEREKAEKVALTPSGECRRLTNSAPRLTVSEPKQNRSAKRDTFEGFKVEPLLCPVNTG